MNSIVSATGAAKPSFDTSGSGHFAFTGDVAVSPDRIAADNFDLKMGDDAASARWRWRSSLCRRSWARSCCRASISAAWLEILSRPIDFTPEEVKEAVPQTAASVPSAWAALNADVEITIAETHFHHDVIRDLDAHLQASKGSFTLSRIKALLPGNMKIDADASTGASACRATNCATR